LAPAKLSPAGVVVVVVSVAVSVVVSVVVSVDVAVVVAVSEVVVVTTPAVPPQVHPLWLWQLACVDKLPHSAALPSHTGASCHVHPGASKHALWSLSKAWQETLCPPMVVVPVHVVWVFQVQPF